MAFHQILCQLSKKLTKWLIFIKKIAFSTKLSYFFKPYKPYKYYFGTTLVKLI